MFGKVLKNLRKGKKYSIREFAKLIRKKDGGTLSPSYLCDIEQERRNPPENYIIEQMAGLLDVEKDYLLGFAETTTPDIPRILRETPELGKLLRKAKQLGFDDWKSIEKLINRKINKN